MTVAPDGRVWFTEPLAVFDGEAWTRYEMPGPRSMKPEARHVRSLAFTPDGNVWMLAENYQSKSRVLMLDLAEVEPMAVEPA